MINKKILIAAILGVTVGGALTLPTGRAQEVMSEYDLLRARADSIAREQAIRDSLAVVFADSVRDAAAESYKNFKFIKSEGSDYDRMFPAAYDCFKSNLQALELFEPQSSAWSASRSVLLDIDPDLEAAAYYYSSQHDNEKFTRFARAFLDVQLLDAMKGIPFKRDPEPFAIMSYNAASNAYNNQEYDRAIEYFKLYFSTGSSLNREQVYIFMGQACVNAKRYPLAITTFAEGLKQFPLNKHMAMMGVQACIDGGDPDNMQEFLTKAIELNPGDMRLLAIQGKLYEDRFEYKNALDIFNRIDQANPNNLETVKHIGLCYYNIGVDYFQRSVNEENEKMAVKNRRQAKTYYAAAAQKLEEVVATDPMAVRYLRALGISYLFLEEKEKFEDVKRQLAALGEEAFTDEMFMPPMMSYDANGANYASSGQSANTHGEAPLYSEYAEKYITEALGKWSKKGEFETIEAYSARVNDVTIRNEYDRLNREAQEKYLEEYAGKLRLSDLKLKPYDATNETFLIESSYGSFTLKVPLKDGEAESFKSNWEGMRFRNPKWMISDNRVGLASITVQSPTGKSYSYENDNALAYTQQNVKIDFEAILADQVSNTGATNARKSNDVTITRKSDVDMDIPVSRKTAPNTFALVISNEDYEFAATVQSAIHDGERFAEYCNKVLGLPQQNVTFVKNATVGRMVGAITNLKNTVNAIGPNSEVILYYAGHGMPDEATKDAFLLPTDAEPSTVASTGYSLNRLYAELEDMKAGSVMVFLDACFSGASRDGGMVQDARGVVMKPKEAAPRGSMFVLSAASGQETAMPYTEKNHGLFTYYVLKKLQESKGNVTLKELSDYVIDNVRRQSNVINRKSQTPTVKTSGKMATDWTSKKLRP